MSERETIKKVKQNQGILSKIQNIFTLGYGTKEDLRELDKKLRDLYYADLRDIRHTCEDIYLAVLDAGASSSRDYKKVIQILDRLMEKVRHADYGYAGLMDRKGHIREEELAHIFNYDKTMDTEIENLKQAIKQIGNEAEAEKWEAINEEIKKVKKTLLDFEDKWQEREKRFRPLDV